MGGFGYLAQGPTPVSYYQDQLASTNLKQAQTQNLLQEKQIQQQQSEQEQQLNQFKIQQAQQDQQSKQAIMKAWQEANGVVGPQMIQAAAKYGAQPSDLTALQQHAVTMQKQVQDLDTATLASHSAHTDLAAGHINSLLQQPDDQAAQQYPQLMQSLIQEHDLNPDDLQKGGLDPSTYPGRQALQTFMLGLNGYKSQIATEQKNREVAAQELKAKSDAESAGATTAEKQTETTQKQRALDAAALTIAAKQGPGALQTALEALPYGRAKVFEGVTDPGQIQRLGMTPDEQVKADQAAALQAQTMKHQGVEESQGAQRIGIERQRLANEGASVGTGGQPGIVAQMVGNYQMPLQTALQRTPPAFRNQIMEQVKQVNPDYHSEYYNTFQKTENDATTGKIGTSANALNTMMGHLTVLNNAAGALDNGNVQVLNKLANSIGAQTGNDARTVYDTIVHRLGPEVTKAYLASGGSVGERGTNEEDFSSSLGPKQIKSNIGVSAYLADSKIKALQDQYQRGTYGKGQQKLISDEADQARQTLTKQTPAAVRGGDTVRVKNAQGQVGTIPKANLDKALKVGYTQVQ
jgi:hypothetical protein